MFGTDHSSELDVKRSGPKCAFTERCGLCIEIQRGTLPGGVLAHVLCNFTSNVATGCVKNSSACITMINTLCRCLLFFLPLGVS